jgi:DNA-binding NarL/FixJ family response regulator
VLVCLVEGLEYKEIADKLFISPATARTHIANIYQKLHANSKVQAIKIAFKNRWV